MATSLIFLALAARQNFSATVTVVGEGQLRFAQTGRIALSSTATLSPNAQGLLADAQGRVIMPQIKLGSGPLKVAMNGTVTVAGIRVGRLALQRSTSEGPEIGYPGEGSFGLIETSNSVAGNTPAPKTSAAPTPTRTTATASTGKVSVNLHPTTELPTDRVTLGDIADLSGETNLAARLARIDLGGTPLVGQRRTLTEWSIRAAIRGAGIKDDQFSLVVPAECTVARKGQTIGASDITDYASNLIKGQFAVTDLRLITGPAPAKVPLGNVEMSGQLSRQGDTVAVTVWIEVDGKRAADRSIKFNAVVEAVRVGDTLKAIVSRNGAVVEVQVRVKSAGAVGDSIQVVTEQGTVLTAVLKSRSLAEVKL